MSQVSLPHLSPFLRYFIRKFWKRRIFRPFFPCIYRHVKIAIFLRFSNRDFAHQMTSEQETATMFVVFSSLYKMVMEFLRYLHSCRNGAQSKISPKTTNNDPTLEPPGGRIFWLGWPEFHSPHNFVHSPFNGICHIHKFRIELLQ